MAKHGTDDEFYAALPAFDRFDEFVDFDAYTPVPEDWVVMIADVIGSTRAIARGRYKDVNMVGAASITAVLNVCGEIEVPYVFGGDGGTLVVPGSLHAAAAGALQQLQAVSQDLFGLGLRAGAVPVSELRADGFDVSVRKYALSPGNHLAMFTGGGLERADTLLKLPSDGNSCLLAVRETAGAPDLTGLSCRWEPLRPENGRMLTLMVQGHADSEDAKGRILADALKAISEILGHGLRESAPANGFSLRLRWPPRDARLEARVVGVGEGVWREYIWVLATSLVQLFCELFKTKAGGYDGAVYREELKSNTDFRKYDGVLRAVLDVTEAQSKAIERRLETEHRKGRLAYGMHVSDTALMTCLVFDLGQSEHVHFVDGSDGGFAMASVGFKARLAALESGDCNLSQRAS